MRTFLFNVVCDEVSDYDVGLVCYNVICNVVDVRNVSVVC